LLENIPPPPDDEKPPGAGAGADVPVVNNDEFPSFFGYAPPKRRLEPPPCFPAFDPNAEPSAAGFGGPPKSELPAGLD